MTREELFDARYYPISSSLINQGDFRLNSEFYETQFYHGDFEHIATVELGQIARVFHPGITKRLYVENPIYGVPFLSTSDMQMLEATENKFVSKEHSQNIAEYIVTQGTILLSRSGTIGTVAVVDKLMHGCAVTEHAIRIIPNNPEDLGLIVAYLNSEIGQKTIKGKKSGAVIDEVYDEDVKQLKIPEIPQSIKLLLNQNIRAALENREQATELLRVARQRVKDYCGLAEIQDKQLYNQGADSDSLTYGISNYTLTNDFRLDAHVYNSLALTIESSVKNCSQPFDTLDNLCNEIILGKRFKRNYVTSAHGTPFLGSKNILQIRPLDIKYLSNSEISFLDDLLLSSNMILIACSGSLGGTFGQAAFVYKNFESFAASQHILRLMPNSKKIDPGYLFAYLSSDFGYYSITRFRWGALIDEIDDEDMKKVIVPICSEPQQKEIGDIIRECYTLRANAIDLENQAQAILTESMSEA